MNVKIKFNVSDEVWVVLKKDVYLAKKCLTCGQHTDSILTTEYTIRRQHIDHISIGVSVRGEVTVDYITKPLRAKNGYPGSPGYYHWEASESERIFKSKEAAVAWRARAKKEQQTKPV